MGVSIPSRKKKKKKNVVIAVCPDCKWQLNVRVLTSDCGSLFGVAASSITQWHVNVSLSVCVRVVTLCVHTLCLAGCPHTVCPQGDIKAAWAHCPCEPIVSGSVRLNEWLACKQSMNGIVGTFLSALCSVPLGESPVWLTFWFPWLVVQVQTRLAQSSVAE